MLSKLIFTVKLVNKLHEMAYTNLCLTLIGLMTGGICDEYNARSSEFRNHINQIDGDAVDQ